MIMFGRVINYIFEASTCPDLDIRFSFFYSNSPSATMVPDGGER